MNAITKAMLTKLAIIWCPLLGVVAFHYLKPWLHSVGLTDGELEGAFVATVALLGIGVSPLALTDPHNVAQKISSAIQWGAANACNPAVVSKASDAARAGTLESVDPSVLSRRTDGVHLGGGDAHIHAS